MRKASPRETRGLADTKIRSEAAGRKGVGGNARRFLACQKRDEIEKKKADD